MNKLQLLSNSLKKFFSNKTNSIIVAAAIVVLSVAFISYQKLVVARSNLSLNSNQEIDLTFDPEGAYVLLFPRKDGNAMTVDLERTTAYDAIAYELTYNSDGIDRGVVGNIDTRSRSSSYNQEILFGTCSKNVCAYDKDVESGTLVLHLKKNGQAYRMITQWHIQNLLLVKGVLTSGDDHFSYKIDPKAPSLNLINYSIVNDLSGAPKLPNGKTVVGKVYAVDSPATMTLPQGEISIELADKPGPSAKVYHYDLDKGEWQELDTTISGSTLSASSPSGGIFAVLENQ